MCQFFDFRDTYMLGITGRIELVMHAFYFPKEGMKLGIKYPGQDEDCGLVKGRREMHYEAGMADYQVGERNQSHRLTNRDLSAFILPTLHIACDRLP